METFWSLFLFSIYWMFIALWFGTALGKGIQAYLERSATLPGSSRRPDYSGCSIVITLVVVIAFLALPLFFLTQEEKASLSLLGQIAAAALGGLTALGLTALFKYRAKIEHKALKIPFILSMVLAGLTLAAMLILSFTEIELPFSRSLLWIPVGLPVLLALADIVIDNSRKATGHTHRDSSSGTSSSLDAWVTTIEFYMVAQEKSRWTGKFNHHQEMRDAREALKAGTLDQALQDPKFFHLTEEILINLVLGREVLIQDQDIYQAREEVVRTLQAVYFYALDRFPQYQMHPALQKALKK